MCVLCERERECAPGGVRCRIRCYEPVVGSEQGSLGRDTQRECVEGEEKKDESRTLENTNV